MPRRQDGGFLADMFERADPETANFMARHNALLERVMVLERALEEILSTEPEAYTNWDTVYAICREALDA